MCTVLASEPCNYRGVGGGGGGWGGRGHPEMTVTEVDLKKFQARRRHVVPRVRGE